VPRLVSFAAAVADEAFAAIIARVAALTLIDFTCGVFAVAWKAVKCFRHWYVLSGGKRRGPTTTVAAGPHRNETALEISVAAERAASAFRAGT